MGNGVGTFVFDQTIPKQFYWIPLLFVGVIGLIFVAYLLKMLADIAKKPPPAIIVPPKTQTQNQIFESEESESEDHSEKDQSKPPVSSHYNYGYDNLPQYSSYNQGFDPSLQQNQYNQFYNNPNYTNY